MESATRGRSVVSKSFTMSGGQSECPVVEPRDALADICVKGAKWRRHDMK